MRIAIPYENGQIFQHFGHTEQFKVYEVIDGQITRSVIVIPASGGHCGLADDLTSWGVDALICGGIGGGAQMALAEADITVYGGVEGSADAAAEALARGELVWDPDAHCDHHEHGEGHSCGHHGPDHGCGHHGGGHCH